MPGLDTLLIRHLLQNREVPWVPRLGDDVDREIDFSASQRLSGEKFSLRVAAYGNIS